MPAFAKTIPVLDTTKPFCKQKGYSIVELSIALAIISIILVTALAGVQRILRSNNVNEDLRNLNLLASKLTVMLSTVPNTAGIAQAQLANLRMFEGFKTNAAGVLINSFNGGITVAPNNAQLGTVPANGGLIIYSTGLPPEVCSDYITGLDAISSHISAAAFVPPAVPAVVGGAMANVVKTNVVPITIANLATACTAPAGSTITVAALIGT